MFFFSKFDAIVNSIWWVLWIIYWHLQAPIYTWPTRPHHGHEPSLIIGHGTIASCLMMWSCQCYGHVRSRGGLTVFPSNDSDSSCKYIMLNSVSLKILSYHAGPTDRYVMAQTRHYDRARAMTSSISVSCTDRVFFQAVPMSAYWAWPIWSSILQRNIDSKSIFKRRAKSFCKTI